MSDDGKIDKPKQRHCDIGDDAWKSYAQYLAVHSLINY